MQITLCNLNHALKVGVTVLVVKLLILKARNLYHREKSGSSLKVAALRSRVKCLLYFDMLCTGMSPRQRLSHLCSQKVEEAFCRSCFFIKGLRKDSQNQLVFLVVKMARYNRSFLQNKLNSSFYMRTTSHSRRLMQL